MGADETFERFARRATAGSIIGLRLMDGSTFTESDRRMLEDALGVIRTSMVQPVGATRAAARVKGAVTDAEYDRAVVMVLAGAMMLWASGKLDAVEVDGEE